MIVLALDNSLVWRSVPATTHDLTFSLCNTLTLIVSEWAPVVFNVIFADIVHCHRAICILASICLDLWSHFVWIHDTAHQRKIELSIEVGVLPTSRFRTLTYCNPRNHLALGKSSPWRNSMKEIQLCRKNGSPARRPWFGQLSPKLPKVRLAADLG